MQATIKTTKGSINIDLFHEKAKMTVSNFANLSQRGFYNNLTFHRVIDDFMIQGGCPIGTGTGDAGYKFKDEFHNDLKHDKPGVLSMANSGPNTNGSQFFIVHGSQVSLPPNYTIFGQVTGGEDTVDKIANSPVGASVGGELSAPIEPIIIDSIEITQR